MKKNNRKSSPVARGLQHTQQDDGLVSQRAYAKMRGLHPSTISRQVRSGAIPSHDGLIDPNEADAARAANLDPIRGRRKQQASAASDPASDATGAPPPFSESHARKEKSLADTREMEAATMRGKLHNVADCDRRIGLLIVATKDALLSLPPRLMNALSVETDPGACLQIVKAGIERALYQLIEAQGGKLDPIYEESQSRQKVEAECAKYGV
ncbi:MAG: hypothetical protein LAQ69_15210 [Acidobacteriia bacterium]|nr:hypothetical protein [Terriglobia bacterium]